MHAETHEEERLQDNRVGDRLPHVPLHPPHEVDHGEERRHVGEAVEPRQPGGWGEGPTSDVPPSFPISTATPRGSAQPRFAAASRATAATSAVTDCALGAANRLLVT